MALKRGLISVRTVRGPLGSSSISNRWAFTKKNSLSLMIGPESWALRSSRLLSTAGSVSEGLASFASSDTLSEEKLPFVQ